VNKNLYISIGINLLLVCVIGWILMAQFANDHQPPIKSEAAIIAEHENKALAILNDSLVNIVLEQEKTIAQNVLKRAENKNTKKVTYETINKSSGDSLCISVHSILERWTSSDSIN
jgi:hypothetical protein